MQKAVEISRGVSPDKEIEDIQQLRRQFTSTVQEFYRSLARVRRNLEDELYLDKLAQMQHEQSQLAERTHTLMEAMLQELQAENAYSEALAVSERHWEELAAMSATITLLDLTFQEIRNGAK